VDDGKYGIGRIYRLFWVAFLGELRVVEAHIMQFLQRFF
ncbi:MAG: hypothetical protein RIT42_609, partial [Bacteroidota bacterium]